MTVARIGHGAQFWLDSASDVLTKLGEVTSISLPNSQVADVEATHFESPNRRREYIAGMIEDGEGTFEMNYDPNSASDVILRAAIADGVVRDYKIVVPDSAANWEITGDCIVKSYERSVPNDDRMTASFTVRFTGAVSEAAAA
jgi:predicted secreted protein